MSLTYFIKNRQSTIVMLETDTVMDAVRAMTEQRSGAVLIAREGPTLAGIFTERDVMTRVVSEKRDPDTTSLGEVMTSDVIQLDPDIPINDAIKIMQEHRIRHVPVVSRDGEILGMLSLRFLLHDRIQELADELNSLEAYLNDAPGG